MNEESNLIENDEVMAVRAVVLDAYADCIPELVYGETVTELLASIEPARAAFARIAQRMSIPETPEIAPLPAVPAGGGKAVIDPEQLPTAEKVRRGLTERNRSFRDVRHRAGY